MRRVLLATSHVGGRRRGDFLGDELSDYAVWQDRALAEEYERDREGAFGLAVRTLRQCDRFQAEEGGVDGGFAEGAEDGE